MVFRDPADGAFYIVYGGWRHCNIARLNDSFTGFIPFADGTTFKEITPAGYVEGAFMLPKDGKYYFMWSEGGWTGPNYAVAYAIGTSPTGPFTRIGKILQQDSSVATGAGHHSVIQSPVSKKWYIVYHRRPLGETDRNHRVVSIDEMRFDDRGFILPVKITKVGVAPDPLPLDVDCSRRSTISFTETDSMGVVAGRVASKEHPAGIAGAGLVLSSDGRRILSDGTGRFRFEGVAPGKYLLGALAIGQRPANDTIVLRPGKGVDVAVTMVSTGGPGGICGFDPSP
jgi:hypothetical protein